MPGSVAAGGPSQLRFSVVNPLDHEEDLKALMTGHGHTAFTDFFDRGYRDAVAEGGASWVGFDDAGRIQISLTQFVHHFQFQGAHLRAGFTGNVMAAQSYRAFFPAFALFRRMLSDTRARGEIDFTYGDPTPQAVAISKAVKMEHVADLDRLVLPIGDPSIAKHVGARLFARAPFLLGGRIPPDVRWDVAASHDLREFEPPRGPHDRMIAHHSKAMLHRRLPDFPGAKDYVVELRWDKRAKSWDALVLLRLGDDARILSILSIRRRSDIPLRGVIPALAQVARRLGAYRLQIETIRESKMAREFCSLGFRPRGDVLPIFVKSFSKLGDEAIRNVAQWELTALDMER